MWQSVVGFMETMQHMLNLCSSGWKDKNTRHLGRADTLTHTLLIFVTRSMQVYTLALTILMLPSWQTFPSFHFALQVPRRLFSWILFRLIRMSLYLTGFVESIRQANINSIGCCPR
jgi:hypothetical protein